MCHVTHGGIRHVIQCSAPSAASKESQWRWAVCVLITPLCLEPSPLRPYLYLMMICRQHAAGVIIFICHLSSESEEEDVFHNDPGLIWWSTNLFLSLNSSHSSKICDEAWEWFSLDKPQTAVLIMVVLDVRLLLYSHLFGHDYTSNCTLLFLVSYVRLQLKRSIWRYAFTTWTVCTCVKDD